ncbi:hypothetical protein XM38_015010 [Halomicronema hongdechloris C2206]|uniref:Uncharacterized protein n=1 Tax=Halomicronema hongdechloris C2206 TaxID=1641165 RepID=A0A1Z3HJS8_9CYAN|nr:hypothetical protein XM38_015010 [Halomicronema hongdechloris C2206]
MATCPCCTNHLMRHIRNQEVYWFCRHCWQAMPAADDGRLAIASLGHRLDKVLQPSQPSALESLVAMS